MVKDLIDKSKRLEGLPRHASMHAAGVLICGKPVEDYVPLSTGSDGAVVAQFVMTTLEELGLLKMDFLGLRTLTVIKDAENLIKNIIKVSLFTILITLTRAFLMPSVPVNVMVYSSLKVLA